MNAETLKERALRAAAGIWIAVETADERIVARVVRGVEHGGTSLRVRRPGRPSELLLLRDVRAARFATRADVDAALAARADQLSGTGADIARRDAMPAPTSTAPVTDPSSRRVAPRGAVTHKSGGASGSFLGRRAGPTERTRGRAASGIGAVLRAGPPALAVLGIDRESTSRTFSKNVLRPGKHGSAQPSAFRAPRKVARAHGENGGLGRSSSS